MTSYSDKGPKPDLGQYFGFDHITFWVGNAKQAAVFYTTRLGFKEVAYSGLETGNRDIASHVVQQDKVYFVFKSPLNPGNEEFAKAMLQHGDGAKDVAFTVDDCRGIYQKALERGARSVKEPYELSDANGTVVLATIQTVRVPVFTFMLRPS